MNQEKLTQLEQSTYKKKNRHICMFVQLNRRIWYSVRIRCSTFWRSPRSGFRQTQHTHGYQTPDHFCSGNWELSHRKMLPNNLGRFGFWTNRKYVPYNLSLSLWSALSNDKPFVVVANEWIELLCSEVFNLRRQTLPGSACAGSSRESAGEPDKVRTWKVCFCFKCGLSNCCCTGWFVSFAIPIKRYYGIFLYS